MKSEPEPCKRKACKCKGLIDNLTSIAQLLSFHIEGYASISVVYFHLYNLTIDCVCCIYRKNKECSRKLCAPIRRDIERIIAAMDDPEDALEKILHLKDPTFRVICNVDVRMLRIAS